MAFYLPALNPACLHLGGIVINFYQLSPSRKFAIQTTHVPFLGDGENPDIIITIHSGRLPRLPEGNLVFDSGGTWKLFQSNGDWTFRFFIQGNRKWLSRIMQINHDYSKGDLFIGPTPKLFKIKNSSPRILFAYPIDELLLLHYLAKKRLGAIIHAFGIRHKEHGYAFIGASGAGKSTLARLWQDAGDTMLSDDRLIFRKRGAGYWVYGTPWHGDADASAPFHAPLKKIFFLAKSKRNYLRPLPPTDAVKRLFVCCFPPFHDRASIEFLMDFFVQMVRGIPCFELGVVPDRNIVDFVYQNS